MSPARNLQPKSRDIRYTNMKSAMAEEMLLSLVLRESALLNRADYQAKIVNAIVAGVLNYRASYR